MAFQQNHSSNPPWTRRRWLRATSGLWLAAVGAGCRKDRGTSQAIDQEPLVRYPGKTAMRLVNDRPPCLETPWRWFNEDLTPNNAFYVRWHLQAIPTVVDPQTWRLEVSGNVEVPLALSLDDLQRMEQVSVVAVNQCSGNSRSLFEPRVPGSQWTNGAMGNARWSGVRLADLLDKAGVKKGSVQVAFDGLDEPPLPSVPDYIKAIGVDQALDRDVLVALQMNGEPLPMLNGFPARLVVPGYYATYWVKALKSIAVLTKPNTDFWMGKAYRIPRNAGAEESPSSLAVETVPIGKMNLRSFFVNPQEGAGIVSGRPTALDGIAFDGGSGIKSVEYSTDRGRTWILAKLDPDLGNYSFRRWRGEWTPPTKGRFKLLVRAMSGSGETQPVDARWNRSGYMRNVVETLNVEAV